MNRAALEARYRADCAGGTAIAAHLPRLRALAEGCQIAVEFGVKRGASAVALLLGAEWVISVDLVETPEARALERLTDVHWEYRIADSRTTPIPSCDLLFLDSLHTYAQVRDELAAHARYVKHWLVFHDVTTFGEVAALGETGRQAWTYQPGQSVPDSCRGIRPAIDELMIQDPSWCIAARYTDSHGLLVLERRR